MESHGIEPLPDLRTAGSIRARLSLMMFLQYFIQGSYLPVASLYIQDALGFDKFEIGLFGSALAVGPLFAPFIVGQLVDRHWATQRVLAVSHILGGLTMLWLYTQTEITGFVILGIIYSILYVPTMMLTNSLAFHHLKQRDREFPLIRLFGTIGFVVPAWWVELYWLRGLESTELNEARGIILFLAGSFGILMGAYCWTLPHTPPEGKDDTRFAPAKVIGMLRLRSIASLVVISFFVAVVHKFYFVWNSPYLKDVLRSGGITGAWEQRISSIGQISEVLIMLCLGWAISRHGFKRILAFGIFAYTLRCLIFALAITIDVQFSLQMTLVIFGQALHGVCFACFLAAAFMFVDRVTPKGIRGSMQNIYGTFVIGLGIFAGGISSGALGKWLTTAQGKPTLRESLGIVSRAGMKFDQKKELLSDWTLLWLSCALLGALSLIAFLISFPKEIPQAAPATEDNEPAEE